MYSVNSSSSTKELNALFFSVTFHSLPDCLKKIHDFDFWMLETAFPAEEDEGLVQTHPIKSDKPSILTFMKMWQIKAHQLTPNYFVLPGNIYLFVLLSIVLFAFVSLLASRSKTQDSSLSVRTCVKEMSIYLSDLSLAHIGAIANDLPHWTIHLVLLLSVTLILALYNACFSMDNLHIEFPKYYKVYDDVLQEPPDNILILPSLLEHLEKTYSKRTVENKLVEFASNDSKKIRLPEIAIKGENLVVIIDSQQTYCEVAKGILKSFSGSNAWRTAMSVDPDASEIVSQYSIFPSALNKTRGQRAVKRMRRFVEMGMHKGIYKQVATAQMDLMKRRKDLSSLGADMSQGKPCIDKMEPELDNYRDVNAEVTQPVFAWWFCLLIFTCLLASGEFIAHRLDQINQHKNKVAPLTIRVRAHSVV